VSGLAYLFIALALSVLGSLVLYLLHRKPSSLEHGIEEFAREMRALAPDDDDRLPRGRERRRGAGPG
jgi:hypothetical protein